MSTIQNFYNLLAITPPPSIETIREFITLNQGLLEKRAKIKDQQNYVTEHSLLTVAISFSRLDVLRLLITEYDAKPSDGFDIENVIHYKKRDVAARMFAMHAVAIITKAPFMSTELPLNKACEGLVNNLNTLLNGVHSAEEVVSILAAAIIELLICPKSKETVCFLLMEILLQIFIPDIYEGKGRIENGKILWAMIDDSEAKTFKLAYLFELLKTSPERQCEHFQENFAYCESFFKQKAIIESDDSITKIAAAIIVANSQETFVTAYDLIVQGTKSGGKQALVQLSMLLDRCKNVLTSKFLKELNKKWFGLLKEKKEAGTLADTDQESYLLLNLFRASNKERRQLKRALSNALKQKAPWPELCIALLGKIANAEICPQFFSQETDAYCILFGNQVLLSRINHLPEVMKLHVANGYYLRGKTKNCQTVFQRIETGNFTGVASKIYHQLLDRNSKIEPYPEYVPDSEDEEEEPLKKVKISAAAGQLRGHSEQSADAAEHQYSINMG